MFSNISDLNDKNEKQRSWENVFTKNVLKASNFKDIFGLSSLTKTMEKCSWFLRQPVLAPRSP